MEIIKQKRVWQVFVLLATVFGICIVIKGRADISSSRKGFFAMDTYMTVTVEGSKASKAAELAEREVNRLDEELSTGIEDSPVSTINRTGEGYLPEDLDYLLKRSYEIYQMTEGAFDITIYPVMKAWGFGGDSFCVPKAETLKELLNHVNMDGLQYDQQLHVLHLESGAMIDFGGIAKGYTGDRVASVLQERGVKSAMINLGGNVRVIGRKSDGNDWRIAIQSPDSAEQYLGVVSAHDVSIVTSGGYQRYFEKDGIVYHHIIDPDTGYPANSGLLSVTIISEDGTLADGLSTALFVMGKDDAIKLWKEYSDMFEFILYTEKRELYVSSGIYDTFTSELPVYIVE